MPLLFNVERVRTEDGRVRWRRVPTYTFVGWTLRERSPTRLVYRPGWRPLAWRLALAGVCLGLAWWIYSASRRADRPRSLSAEEIAQRDAIQRDTDALKQSMRRQLGEETWSRLEKDIESRRLQAQREMQERQARLARLQRVRRYFYNAMVSVLAVIGVVPPLCWLWNRTSIEALPSGELQVRSWLLLPARRVWSEQSFSHLLIQATERRTRRANLGYIWTVRLENLDEQTVLNVMPVVFVPHQQRDRPHERDALPEPVQVLVDWLAERLSLPQTGPIVTSRGDRVVRYDS
jgi:hypothetical protein